MTGLSGPRYHWRSPFYDNTSKRSFLCWCDNWRQHWAEIHFYGLKCGLFGIVLHLTGRAGMHVVVPNSTEQDCVVLDSALDWTRLHCYWLIWTRATMDLNVLGWKGMDWNWTRTNSIGLDWTGLDWTGADSMEWTGPHVSGVDRTGLSRTALQKTELDGMHFTGLDCLTLSLTSLDCTTLHYPGLNWKVPYRTVTAPR